MKTQIKYLLDRINEESENQLEFSEKELEIPQNKLELLASMLESMLEEILKKKRQNNFKIRKKAIAGVNKAKLNARSYGKEISRKNNKELAKGIIELKRLKLSRSEICAKLGISKEKYQSIFNNLIKKS
jgi:DNA invertase Pin-like site-specific DNA recombinase